MASIINASVTSNGIVQTADASGILQLQSNGTTGLTVNSGGKVVYANTSLAIASAGTLEYDGLVPYFTPQGTQRGVIPGMQYYRLNSTVAGSNVNTAQSILGVGVTLSSSTIYAFEALYVLTKTAGATSHTIGLGFGGTATFNNITFQAIANWSAGSSNPVGLTSAPQTFYSNVATNTTATAALANAATYYYGVLRGTMSMNTGGTVIPQYTLSAAPGGAYTTAAGSYFLIYPIGTAGSNISVGTWA